MKSLTLAASLLAAAPNAHTQWVDTKVDETKKAIVALVSKAPNNPKLNHLISLLNDWNLSESDKIEIGGVANLIVNPDFADIRKKILTAIGWPDSALSTGSEKKPTGEVSDWKLENYKKTKKEWLDLAKKSRPSRPAWLIWDDLKKWEKAQESLEAYFASLNETLNDPKSWKITEAPDKWKGAIKPVKPSWWVASAKEGEVKQVAFGSVKLPFPPWVEEMGIFLDADTPFSLWEYGPAGWAQFGTLNIKNWEQSVIVIANGANQFCIGWFPVAGHPIQFKGIGISRVVTVKNFVQWK